VGRRRERLRGRQLGASGRRDYFSSAARPAAAGAAQARAASIASLEEKPDDPATKALYEFLDQARKM
jgi:hypothetical protein